MVFVSFFNSCTSVRLGLSGAAQFSNLGHTLSKDPHFLLLVGFLMALAFLIAATENPDCGNIELLRVSGLHDKQPIMSLCFLHKVEVSLDTPL